MAAKFFNHRKIAQATIFLGLFALASTYNACSQDYQLATAPSVAPVEPLPGLVDGDGGSEPPTPVAPGNKVSTESFSSDTQEVKEIDMIWIVDNSGSMSEEAAHVRTNISAFAKTLAGYVDLKLALISAAGSTDTKVSLPADLLAAGAIQINKTVNSTDALQILVQYKDVLKKDFLRPGVRKVVVLVTDDNSAINTDKFLQDLGDSELAKANYFGFVGLGPSMSPCEAAPGNVYVNLADGTAGDVFNICDKDWSQHFSGLTKSTIELADSSFTLAKKPVKVVSVKVNSTLLKSSQYAVSGSNVVIDSSLFSGVGKYTVVIAYEHQ